MDSKHINLIWRQLKYKITIVLYNIQIPHPIKNTAKTLSPFTRRHIFINGRLIKVGWKLNKISVSKMNECANGGMASTTLSLWTHKSFLLLPLIKNETIQIMCRQYCLINPEFADRFNHHYGINHLNYPVGSFS